MTTTSMPQPTLEAMERQYAVERFLVDEAEALDEWRLRDWLGMLTEDVIYQVPIRIHKEVGDDGSRVTGIQTNSYHLDESRTSLEMRVERIETGFAWAEEPPTRTRHLVGNVRVRDGEDDATLDVRSNVLLYHTRWDRPEYTVLSAERRDVLRRDGDALRLARRLVVLDNTVIPTLNLSFFL
jgi:ethylbenzene dioxygenase subunit beta